MTQMKTLQNSNKRWQKKTGRLMDKKLSNYLRTGRRKPKEQIYQQKKLIDQYLRRKIEKQVKIKKQKKLKNSNNRVEDYITEVELLPTIKTRPKIR